jgi:hypothetical protein
VLREKRGGRDHVPPIECLLEGPVRTALRGRRSSSPGRAAYHVGGDLSEPAELVVYCPECAERELGGD